MKNVAVLMGGWSAEREVSLASGEAAVAILKELGYTVNPIDVQRDFPALMAQLTPKPDVVFNALHGPWGEDGVIQGLLEVMGIPYTHSGVSASALAMNKVLSRQIFERAGFSVPNWRILPIEELKKGHPIPIPYVIKPIREGSSKGVHIILAEEQKPPLENWPYGQQVLVEDYILGREIHVAVMGDRALGAIEIRPYEEFYDYTAKYTPGRAEHLMPAPLPAQDYEEVLQLGLKAHQSLGCRGITRSDFLYDEERKTFYLLEVNTQPGLTPLSLVPEIAAHQGLHFSDLIHWMVQEAQCDQ